MNHLRIASACVLTIALGGCQTGPSPAASPVPPSPAATTASASSPAPAGSVAVPTEPPASFPSLMTLALDDSGPFITSDDGPPGSRYALPAAGARDRDGGHVLFIVWFGEGPEDIWVTVSRSRDGRTWNVGTEPIFTSLGVGVPDPGPIPSSALQLEDGSWVLYGWASDDPEGSSFSSWRASAPALEGPWTIDAGDILAPGPAASWDSVMVAVASVQRSSDGYLAWYEGQPPGSEIRGDIGLATSDDGLAWAKFDDPTTTDAHLDASDPVIARGICGPGTAAAVFQPQVERAESGYVAVFSAAGEARGATNLYGAVSTDGRSWTCGTPSALLSPEEIPGSEGIHTIASLPLDDGRVLVIIESLGDGKSELWQATVETKR